MTLKKNLPYIWIISAILVVSTLVGFLLFSRRKSRRGEPGVTVD